MEDFFYKKKYGQNFLIDKNIINKIINIIDIENDNFVIEIGPGNGALTNEIIKKTNNLILIEIDNNLIEILKKLNVEILNEDVLKVDFDKILLSNRKNKIIGNLPYNIATQVLFKLINNNKIECMYFMFQKEVGERIIAKPNNKSFSRLSVMTQTFWVVEKKQMIKKTSFFPIPKVDGMFLSFSNFNIPFNEKLLFEYEFFVKNCFLYKRKILINNLSKNYSSEKINYIFRILNIDKNIRAEQLEVQEFIKIFELIFDN